MKNIIINSVLFVVISVAVFFALLAYYNPETVGLK